MAAPTREQLQVWLEDPVTKWIKAALEKDRKDLDFKLRSVPFTSLEEVTKVQVTLDLVDRWTDEPERRLQKLITSSVVQDDPYN